MHCNEQANNLLLFVLFYDTLLEDATLSRTSKLDKASLSKEMPKLNTFLGSDHQEKDS